MGDVIDDFSLLSSTNILCVAVLDLLQNSLCKIDYKLLVAKTIVFFCCFQGDNLCSCPNILEIQLLVYSYISGYRLGF